MSNSLFSNNENSSNNQNELSGEDSLKLLVGENCKYATVEDMAKGMVHSQNHITTLEKEATTFTDQQSQQTQLKDILDAVKAGGQQQQPQDDNQNHSDQNDKGSEQVDIAKTVQDALAKQNATNSEEANVKLVEETLKKALGDRVATMYSKVGNDLGVDLDELSKTSPSAVIRLVTGQGQPANQQNNSLPASTHVTIPEDTSGELNYDAIQVVFKKGGMSREKKFELEQQQAQKLGSRFFNHQ